MRGGYLEADASNCCEAKGRTDGLVTVKRMRFLLLSVVLTGVVVVAACQGDPGPQDEPGEVQVGLGEVQVGIGLALDKAAYLAHGEETVGDESISVYGSGFIRGEYVLPQIQGANPRGFRAEGVNADANGAFSTTISLLTGASRVQPGVYPIRVTGGEGSVATIPIVIVEAEK